MEWNSEELTTRLKAAAQQEDNDEVLQIGRPTGTPISKTVLFDGKRLSEQLRKAGEEETENFPLVGRPTGTQLTRESISWLPSDALRKKLLGLWEARKRAGHTETLRELHDALLGIALEKMNHQEETVLL